ncbi:hypothetical protein Btru_047275 [Bulinus truncatus]|nr:hypothetical protein Btru_047275 [Bulinus truncatus]
MVDDGWHGLIYFPEVSSTNSGRLFYVATPDLFVSSHHKESKIIFSLLTHYQQLTVQITKQGNTSSLDLNDAVLLQRLRVENYELDKMYHRVDNEVTIDGAFRFFAEDGLFFLSVTFFVDSQSGDSFQALPAQGWGTTYFTLNLRETFSLQIVTDYGPVTLTIKFRFGTKDLVLRYKDVYIKDSDEKRFVLQARSALIFSSCKKYDRKSSDATGTWITGDDKFGVISTSCHGVTTSRFCNQTQLVSSIVAEMLLPVDCYGTEFVSLVTRDRLEQGYLLIVASAAQTEVKVYSPTGHSYLMLSLSGDSITKDLDKDIISLRSNLPVQVAYVQRSTCLGSSLNFYGGASMSMLVPTNLFYWTYLFSVRSIPGVAHSVIFVLQLPSMIYILINDQALPEDFSLSLKVAAGNSSWHVGEIAITQGVYQLSSSLSIPFGCYLYGLKRYFSYMHPVGYLAAHFNTECERNIKAMKDSDGLDNDCDRWVDEEIRDEKDNDGDGAIDEDVKELNGLGNWTDWGEWQCTHDCINSNFVRKRFCQCRSKDKSEGVCLGPGQMFKPGDCYIFQKCPDLCPDFQWDVDCVNNCSYCVEPCNKFTGQCSECLEGFKSPDTGCSKECETNEYGVNCLGNCQDKCGTDCLNRKSGTCPPMSSVYLMNVYATVIISAIVSCVSCGVCLCKGKKTIAFTETGDKLPQSTSPTWNAYMMIPKIDSEKNVKLEKPDENSSDMTETSVDFQKKLLLKKAGETSEVRSTDDELSSGNHPIIVREVSIAASEQSEASSDSD